MPFEFYNPHKCVLTCTLPAPHGQVKVMPGDYVPTMEQEGAGISANLLRPHVAPSFLQKTPGHIRRRLRLESDQKATTDEVQARPAPAVAPIPVATPKLEAVASVVVPDPVEQRAPAPVASTQEDSSPANDPTPVTPSPADNIGEGASVATEEQVKEIKLVPPSAPSTPPETPRSLISPRKQAEEGTMSTTAAVRELEESVDRKCSSAGHRGGKRLR